MYCYHFRFSWSVRLDTQTSQVGMKISLVDNDPAPYLNMLLRSPLTMFGLIERQFVT